MGFLFVLLATVALGQTPVTVNCGAGQSLNAKLAGLSRQTAYTVTVMGTCTEYIQVVGFQSLTLKAATGAEIVQPSTAPPSLVTGGTVTSSVHGGLLALNLSSIDMAAGTTMSNISSNSVDLLCDSDSKITGTGNISGTPKTSCANLLPTETVTLP